MTQTTTRYAFRYPEATDPVNVNGDIQNLATDVDTAVYNQFNNRVPAMANRTTGFNPVAGASYAATAAVSTTFVAPITGRVVVHLSCRMLGDGTHDTFMGFQIEHGAGPTIDVAPNDHDVCQTRNTVLHGVSKATLVTGLVSGTTYTARIMTRQDVSGTAFIDEAEVLVVPA